MEPVSLSEGVATPLPTMTPTGDGESQERWQDVPTPIHERHSFMGSTKGVEGTASRPGSPRNPPCKAEAWKYFKTMTQPRRLKNVGKDGKKAYRRMEPGEEGGKLYGIWSTTITQLGEFGLGVGLYYHMVAVVCAMLLAAGLMNSWTMAYFRSKEYSDGQPEVEASMKGSAVCTHRLPVCMESACTDKDVEYFVAEHCEVNLTQGLLDYFTIMMLFLVVFFMGLHQNKTAEDIDVSEQTAQDYSVIVQDPDKDATDPEEWRKFFSKFGHVTYVTVALNNGDFIQALANRRSILQSLMLETGGEGAHFERALNVDEPMKREVPLSCWKKLMQYLGLASDEVYWHEQLRRVTLQLRSMGVATYHASKVYIVFETEEAQRKCLKALTIGYIPAMLEKTDLIDPSRKFRGSNVLKVDEPSEPGEINWVNQHYTLLYRLTEQGGAMTLAAVLVLIAAGIIYVTSVVDPAFAAIFISVSNTILPTIIKIITAREHHLTDSSQQSSLLMKILMVQWMNTAFIVYIITPRSDLLTDEYILQINKDAFTQPLLLLLDLPGKLSHYILAPLAKNQLKMNSYFLGTGWFLAERYSNLLKTVFVALFFSAVFPAGYYIAALAMFVNYWVNKFCLLRIWRTPPPMSDFIAQLSRGYLAIAILTKLLVTLQFYAGWPHNGVAPLDSTYVTSVTPEAAALGVNVGDQVYYDHYIMDGRTDPWRVTVGDWMTGEQKALTRLYSITAVVMTCVIGLVYFGKEAAFSVYHLFRGVYRPVGDSQNISYSSVPQIQAYIPQVLIPTLPHPLLATDLSTLNRDHISWSGDFDQFNLCSANDLPHLTEAERRKLFSPCVHYPDSDHRCSIFAEGPNGPAKPAANGAVAMSGTITPPCLTP